MRKYYDAITVKTTLNHSTGKGLAVSQQFQIYSSTIFSQCVFMQNTIQQIIYTSHGAELANARTTLREFPNPKARVDFLCEFPYTTQDPIVKIVFDYARLLFRDIYEFRNVLAHELWSSSDEYPDSVLFSSLDENSRLLLAHGQLWHKEETTPQDIYDATVRFIRKVKIVNCNHLEAAIRDIDLCSWALMHIKNILEESDEQRKDEARQAFFVFLGTSHLFEEPPSPLPKTVGYFANRSKTIT